jgi:NADH-quinone oxidoreductase E subunit
MAWITKDSATRRIERRDEPYLTEAMQTELRDNIIPRYEVKKGALLPALHMIQHQYGWVPEQAMLEIGRFLEIPPADVQDTTTFYEEYWTERKGKHVVAVCRSIACEFCGHEEITKAACEKLGIEVGETTDDGEFTIIELECLGSCGTAPVALIDETLHENITVEGVQAAIDQARESGGH